MAIHHLVDTRVHVQSLVDWQGMLFIIYLLFVMDLVAKKTMTIYNKITICDRPPTTELPSEARLERRKAKFGTNTMETNRSSAVNGHHSRRVVSNPQKRWRR